MSEMPNGCEIGTVGSSGVVLLLDQTIYRASAIKKAAYKFGDRCHVLLETVSGGRIQATLRPKDKATDVVFLAGDFCNEVLDQELREVVAQETEAIRNLLLAQAFSSTSLIDKHADNGDFEEDPKGIAGPPPAGGL